MKFCPGYLHKKMLNKVEFLADWFGDRRTAGQVTGVYEFISAISAILNDFKDPYTKWQPAIGGSSNGRSENRHSSFGRNGKPLARVPCHDMAVQQQFCALCHRAQTLRSCCSAHSSRHGPQHYVICAMSVAIAY